MRRRLPGRTGARRGGARRCRRRRRRAAADLHRAGRAVGTARRRRADGRPVPGVGRRGGLRRASRGTRARRRRRRRRGGGGTAGAAPAWPTSPTTAAGSASRVRLDRGPDRTRSRRSTPLVAGRLVVRDGDTRGDRSRGRVPARGRACGRGWRTPAPTSCSAATCGSPPGRGPTTADADDDVYRGARLAAAVEWCERHPESVTPSIEDVRRRRDGRRRPWPVGGRSPARSGATSRPPAAAGARRRVDTARGLARRRAARPASGRPG